MNWYPIKLFSRRHNNPKEGAFTERRNDAGFTLVELLVCLGIMILMTSLVLANYRQFGVNAKFAAASEDIVLALREAQVYGVGAKGYTVACGSGVSARSSVAVTGTLGWDATDTATITINGYDSTYVDPVDNETPVTVAQGLTDAINNNGNVNTLVTAVRTGNVVTVTAQTPGTAGNSISISTNRVKNSVDDANGSLSPLGASSMSGGAAGTNFDCGYGVYFTTTSPNASKFKIFVDRDNDRKYSGETNDTTINEVTWDPTISITSLWCGGTGLDCTGDPLTPGAQLSVTFKRPNADTFIADPSVIVPGLGYNQASIVLTDSKTAKTTAVTISSAGQISVQ